MLGPAGGRAGHRSGTDRIGGFGRLPRNIVAPPLHVRAVDDQAAAEGFGDWSRDHGLKLPLPAVEFVARPRLDLEGSAGIGRGDRDDAGRAVLAEEERLRSAQDLDLLHVDLADAHGAASRQLDAVDVDGDSLLEGGIGAGCRSDPAQGYGAAYAARHLAD
ncbi:hypothetical protein D3C77_466970 [compost metagenome]